MSDSAAIAASATSALRRHHERHEGQRHREERRRIGRRRARSGRRTRRAPPHLRRSRRRNRRRTRSIRSGTPPSARTLRADRRTRRRRAAAARPVPRTPSRRRTRARRRPATPRACAAPFGTICATMTGTKKMPPPMTLETTIAAASNGPSRRSSTARLERCGGVEGSARSRATRTALLREQLPRDLHARAARPTVTSSASRRSALPCRGTGCSSASRRASAADRRCSRTATRTVIGSVVVALEVHALDDRHRRSVPARRLT